VFWLVALVLFYVPSAAVVISLNFAVPSITSTTSGASRDADLKRL
jgi:hypothetical protein